MVGHFVVDGDKVKQGEMQPQPVRGGRDKSARGRWDGMYIVGTWRPLGNNRISLYPLQDLNNGGH